VSTQILLQEKLSGAFNYRQNRLGPGCAPDPARELTALPRPHSWWRGLAVPPPKPHPRAFGPSGLNSTAFRAIRADPHNKILCTPLICTLHCISQGQQSSRICILLFDYIDTKTKVTRHKI